MGQIAQPSITEYLAAFMSSSRVESLLRPFAASNSTLTGGVIAFTYFTPSVALNAANLATECAGTTASGLTFAKMGLYTIDGSNNLTCVARTASDTALWNANNTIFTKAIVDNGAASPGAISNYQLAIGQRYAFAILATGTTMPQLAATRLGSGNGGSLAFLSPILSSVSAGGQTDLPASFTSGQVSSTSALYWGALT